MMQTPAERQYLTRHQGDIDAYLDDLSRRDLLGDSVREDWRHAVRSAIIIRNQLKGMRAFSADGPYKGTLINLEQAFKKFVRDAGDDGEKFDRDNKDGYRALIALQRTVAQQVEILTSEDPALAAHSGLAGVIRANSERTRRAHNL